MKSRILACSTLLLLAASPAAAAEDGKCQTCCPRCNVVCVPSREIEKEKKTAYDVSCKWICVPKIHFPWEPCCKPKGAWLRKVKVLEKIEYECPHCNYKWTAKCLSPPCPSGGPSGACPAVQEQHVPDADPPPPPPVVTEGRQTSYDPPSRPLPAPFLRFLKRDTDR